MVFTQLLVETFRRDGEVIGADTSNPCTKVCKHRSAYLRGQRYNGLGLLISS